MDSKEKTWWWRVIYDKMSHGTIDVNNSWSGSRVIHEVRPGRYSGLDMNGGFVDRTHDFIDPDIIIIHGGTNDTSKDSSLGSYVWDLPIGQNNVLTFRGAYIELIKKLQNHYEGVQIILIVGDHLGADYSSSVITIAEHFGLPYVDFTGDKDKIKKCSGSHPTAEGFAFMADKIYETCKDYLP